MKRAFRTVGSLLLILTLSLPLTAQEKKPKPEQKKPTETAAKVEVERILTPAQQQALALLDSLFGKTKEFDDGQARIRAQGQIADTLWEYDEERARRQFEEAYRAISDLKVKKEDEMAFASSPKSRLRSELLRLISPRDSKLVDKLLKAIPDTPVTSNPAFAQIFGAQTEQSSVSMDLAMGLAQEDPQRAAQLLQASLQGSISPMFLQVLLSIRQKDPETADSLFLQALTSGKKDTSNPTMRLLTLASYVFPGLGGAPGAGAASPNPVLAEQFLNFAYDSIMRQLSMAQPNADPQSQQMARAMATIDYLAAQQMLPLFQQYMPEKAALIGNRLQQMGGNLSTQERNQMDSLSSSIKSEGTVSDLVSRADQETDPQQKDMLYMAAASRAAGAGDFDEALSLLDKIKMEAIKSSIGSFIRSQAVMKAMEKGEMDTAYRYAKDIPDLSMRADFFSQIAQKLAEKHDLTRAMEILTDAEKSLSKAENKPDKARALLSLSEAAARIDPPRGFEILRTAVEAVNHTHFDSSSLSELDILNAAAGGLVMQGATLNFERSFAPLARADFQRALGMAQNIEKKELSVSAQISVCRGVLLKARDKPTESKDKVKEPTEKKLDQEKKLP